MKKILLHICCGPCATHPATLLSADYDITGYFYNPNIAPYDEWLRRYEAFKKFAGAENSPFKDFFPKNALTQEEYLSEHQKYLTGVRGYEKEEEGGVRCPICFRMRLEATAKCAKEGGFDLFATTLTIGRNKRPEIINLIGATEAKKLDISFHEANFKKQDGALKGKKIADEHGLYRQHYCGCEFSIQLH